MDERRFDNLAKTLAQPQSRRRLLGAVAVGLFGVLGGARLAARAAPTPDCFDFCVHQGGDPAACRVACRTCGAAGPAHLCIGPDKDVDCCLPQSGRYCQPDGRCCQAADQAGACAGRCGTQTDNCGQTVDCGAGCIGGGGQCCGDGWCANGRTAVCCNGGRCVGECCGNGACAARDAGEHCGGGPPCRGQCRDGVCNTGNNGCRDPAHPCAAGRICLANGTCLLPCGENGSCPATCANSACRDGSGRLVCTTPTIVAKCHLDGQCPYGTACINGRCYTAC